MSEPLQAKPKLLGQSLKWLREYKKATISEVAGAVEVDDATLQDYEDGRDIPSEDILEVLLSYFKLDDERADRLRRLAGYDHHSLNSIEAGQAIKVPVVMLGMDQRVIYTDGLHIEANPEGVVLNFSQGNDPAIPVSRVGMSHAQAEKVANTLEQALLRVKYLAGPHSLPPNTSSHNSTDSSQKK